jgi:DNA-binding transcriptional LysR family regulator
LPRPPSNIKPTSIELALSRGFSGVATKFMDDHMDLEALDYFVKVAELGSVTAAAKLYALPKSTISLKLKRLESQVGVLLFAREGRSITVTDAGSEFLHHARRILSDCEDALAATAEFRNEVAGTLNIASTGEFGSSFTGQMLHAFSQRYPLVKLDLVFFAPTLLLTPDRLQSFDAIMSWDDAGDNELPGVKLGSATFALFASHAYLTKHGMPKTPQDLHEHRGVIYRKLLGLQSWRLQNNGQTTELMPPNEFVANDYWTLKYVAVCGQGIAYLPKFFASIECAHGNLTPVLPEWESDQKWIYIRYKGTRSKKLSAFLDFCTEYFAPGYEFSGPRYYVEAIDKPLAPSTL